MQYRMLQINEEKFTNKAYLSQPMQNLHMHTEPPSIFINYCTKLIVSITSFKIPLLKAKRAIFISSIVHQTCTHQAVKQTLCSGLRSYTIIDHMGPVSHVHIILCTTLPPGLTVTTVPGKCFSTNERRGLIAYIKVVVPHVLRMNRVSEMNILLSLI